MTTMFVQLRRVVYLLVLLQCCVCVAYATSEIDDEEREIRRSVRVLKASLERTDSLYAKGRSCLSVYEKEIQFCNESSLNAVKEAENAVEVITTMKGKTDVLVKEGDKFVESERLVKYAEETLQNTKKAVDDATRFVEIVSQTKKACVVDGYNMEHEAERLKDHYTALLYQLKDKKETEEKKERMELVERGKERHDELYKLMNSTGEVIIRVAEVRPMAMEKTKLAAQAMSRSIADLLWIIKELKNVVPAAEDGENQNWVNQSEKKIKEIVREVHAANPEKTRGEAIAEIRVALEEKKKEEDSLIKEEWVDKEKKIKERVERESNERKAEEERRRKEEEARRAEEEKKRRAEEEKAKQEAERKAREEEAKRVAAEMAKERVKEEEARRVAAEMARERAKEEAEKAKKKKDGGSSPALVRGPLLLIVLVCVLGCTLVC
ncbi:uncharacterized protein TM35_000041340 [Trypanosoma theileri]|uniref:Uncharacterized protein n=1 Tax=Trypanosoma theileri TaxID=67003 RepID=A0A1X0P667_9TRYP|nr:uncharacterized protein TM35_000041340 [Trypanosoma theileri]ORC91920.1 hypothetical protein TM35_000041340 [Trypanosoma theileri]